MNEFIELNPSLLEWKNKSQLENMNFKNYRLIVIIYILYIMTDTLYIIKWFIALSILSILGFNVFKYIAKTTDLAGYFIKSGIDSSSKTLELSKRGTSKILNEVSKGIDSLEESIDKELDFKPIDDYNPSNTDDMNIKQKRGYCFIGQDKGYRSCINVGTNDTCMSGDIFPTMNICVNPNLRV